MKLVNHRFILLTLCLVILISSPSDAVTLRGRPDDSGGSGGQTPAAGADFQPILVRVTGPYGPVVDAIQAAGGAVTRRYKHFGGLAARVPSSAFGSLGLPAGAGTVSKDLRLPPPAPAGDVATRAPHLTRVGDPNAVRFESAAAIPAGALAGFAASHPEAYLINNALTRVDLLHASGFDGEGVVVAVIDSGIRPGFPHLSLDGSVIGCEDFIHDGMGCSNFANDGHGTFVAGMISANVVFGFNPASGLVRSVSRHLPGSIENGNEIPMVGSAPLASIYALRVCNASGCDTSNVLEAMDRAIDLRERYDQGDPAGVKIQVANMSLGGPTLFAGRDLFDVAVDAMLAHDIVVTASAGNAGPSGLTSGSPASSLSSISVGAASIPAYERIAVDLQFGLGIGELYRPAAHIQTAAFSSRGPHADGRRSPDVLASGAWDYGQGFGSSTSVINFASGTSFSSPTVAGIAAVLRQAVPGATARQVINAIVGSANPGILGDRSGPQDQGTGFVDAAAARSLLLAGTVPNALPAAPGYVKSVKTNVQSNAGLSVRNGPVRTTVGPLKPGERGEIIYEVSANTRAVVIDISNFTPSLPPAEQNVLFGDDIFMSVHSARTSRQPEDSGYYVLQFITGGRFVIGDPEPGLLRITVNGDWTNVGDITADVAIQSLNQPLPQLTDQGRIRQDDVILRSVTIPAGTSVAEFRLQWREGYSHYPCNDVDLILVDPDGGLDFRGATLSDPETVVVTNPKAGAWTAALVGFELHSSDDKYELRVTLDGRIAR